MTHYKRGDVVLLPFPFTDLTSSKQRPALIISDDEFNREGIDVVMCAITSQSPDETSKYELSLKLEEMKNAGLPKPSKVKCGKIVTLDSRLIKKKLGKISNSSMKSVTSIINNLICQKMET